MFAHESKLYPVDDMNKIKMGPATAVSRYHQQHRFYMTSNSPDLHDHDFPNPGYLIICSGYQLQVENDPLPDNIPPVFTDIDVNDLTDQTIDIESLPNPEAHPNPMMSYDRLRRTHYKSSKYGPAVLKLRAHKFGSSSAQTHANDLAPILSAQVQDGKTIAFIKVDNGPDWNILNVTNAIYFGRMLRDTGLDILGIVSYAAQWSAYNNIEHLWSPISKRLANVVLPYVLDDDQSHPCQQKELSTEELKVKEAQLFDQSMELIRDTYWKNADFNGSEVTTIVKPSLEEEKPYNYYGRVHSVKFVCFQIMFFGLYNFIINIITKSVNMVIFCLFILTKFTNLVAVFIISLFF